MSTIENIRKAREAAAGPKVAPERSLKEIMADPRESVLFGDFLAKTGGPADVMMISRFRTDQPTDDDIETLDSRYTEFMLRMREAKKYADFLKPDVAEKIASQSPEFSKIVRLVGKERAVQMWKNELLDMAISHEDDFNTVASEFGFLMKNQEEEDARIQAVCDKYKINTKRYEQILALPELKQREEWKRLARDSYGNVGKVMNWMTRGAWAWSAGRSIAKEERSAIAEALSNADVNFEQLGAVLEGTVSNNPLIRDAFRREINAKEKPTRSEVSFVGSAGLEPKDEVVLAEWTKVRPKDFEFLPPDVQDMHRHSFNTSIQNLYREQIQTQPGFWAQVADMFNEWFFITFDQRKLA